MKQKKKQMASVLKPSSGLKLGSSAVIALLLMSLSAGFLPRHAIAQSAAKAEEASINAEENPVLTGDLTDLPATEALESSQPRNDESKALSAKRVELTGTPQDDVGEPDPNNEVCDNDDAQDYFLDRSRKRIHKRLCNTVRWVDSKFGNDYEFDDSEFTGMLSVGFRQDESEGFDPRVRVRIKARLPNVSSRFNAFVGRVDPDSFISNTEDDGSRVNNVGLRSNDEQEDEWLIGLGYGRSKEDRKGFDMSVGAKLNSGLSPYAQVAYRYNITDRDNHHWRSRQTVFWKRNERFGVSTRLNYNYFVDDYNILDWTTDAKHTQEDGWEWITSIAHHHSISSKSGVSSRLYTRGEEAIDVAIPEFGVTFTYITPIFRDWFVMEAGIDFRWEKNHPEQMNYQSQVRAGLQFEMLLGDYYRRYR